MSQVGLEETLRPVLMPASHPCVIKQGWRQVARGRKRSEGRKKRTRGRWLEWKGVEEENEERGRDWKGYGQ